MCRIRVEAGVQQLQSKGSVMPHMHDSGWLKTVDQYNYGSRNGRADACCQGGLSSAAPALAWMLPEPSLWQLLSGLDACGAPSSRQTAVQCRSCLHDNQKRHHAEAAERAAGALCMSVPVTKAAADWLSPEIRATCCRPLASAECS